MTAEANNQALDDAEAGTYQRKTTRDRVKSSHAVPRVAGTDILAWVATTPLVFILIGAFCSKLRDWFSAPPILVISCFYVWYLFVVLVERLLNISATFKAITSASRKETAFEMLERVQDTGTVRVEILMTCFQVPRTASSGPLTKNDHLNCEVTWTGKTQFPFVTAIDGTYTPKNLFSLRVAWVSFENKLEFADEKSALAFDQHVERFVEKNRCHGDGYELVYVLTIPGVSEDTQSLWYGSVQSTKDFRANILIFWAATLLGLTLPYRGICRYTIPKAHITAVKRITTRRSTEALNEDFYPTIDLGDFARFQNQNQEEIVVLQPVHF
jgi:hypothetical protein